MIADNGSTDGSRAIAGGGRARGPDTTAVTARPWQGGIQATRGRYVIMGDTDDTYDFTALDVRRKSAPRRRLAVGNRFKGELPGAMPFLHQYLGNPFLLFLARFSSEPGRHFHCGLRGFNRPRSTLGLRCKVWSSPARWWSAPRCGLRISEVPIYANRTAGPARPIYEPGGTAGVICVSCCCIAHAGCSSTPGLLIAALGPLGGMIWLAALGSIRIFGIELQVHSMLAAGIIGLLGMQTLSFAVLARELAQRRGFLPPSPMLERFWRQASLERAALAGTLLLIGGLIGLVVATIHWAAIGFGNLNLAETMRAVVPSLIAMGVGLQLVLSAFLAGILELPAVTKGDDS